MIGGAGLGSGIGGAIGGIAVLAGAGGKGGEKYHRLALEAWNKLKMVDFDMSKLEPAEQRMVAEIAPQLYDAQIQGDVSLTQDSPEMRESQLRALSQMEEIGETGLRQEDFLAAQDAQRQIGQTQRRYTQSAIQNMAERGRLGAGSELGARMAGGQASSELAASMGRDLQRDAIRNRLNALAMSGQFASDIRGQDVGVSSRRAGERNLFNEWVSALNTNASAANVAAQNQAQYYNVGTAQGISNTNVQNRYANAARNQEYLNDLRQQGFSNQLAKTQGLTRSYQIRGQAKDRERAAKEKAIIETGSGIGGAAGGLFGL